MKQLVCSVEDDAVSLVGKENLFFLAEMLASDSGGEGSEPRRVIRVDQGGSCSVAPAKSFPHWVQWLLEWNARGVEQ